MPFFTHGGHWTGKEGVQLQFEQLLLDPDDYNEKRWLETVALSYLQCKLNRRIFK